MQRFTRLITRTAIAPYTRSSTRPLQAVPYKRSFSWSAARFELQKPNNEDELEEIDPKEYPELYPAISEEEGEIDTEWFVDQEYVGESNATEEGFVPLWQQRALQDRGPIQQVSQALMDSGKLTPETVKELLVESKMDNVEILDLRAKCDWTDYMIIAETPKGERYLSTVAEHLSQVVRKAIESNPGALAAHTFPHIEGRDDNSGWILLDMGRCVVHLFTPEKRRLYDLDGLWKSTPEEIES